ncbi:hypothetical protein K493DRAFT_305699 [Basidiobolus meristosporus CBS 931.73]|uniref:G-protein coupled receptors family 2 profile 2 domain-containing protein n=1 Tax=Basidiobolus meristosporus CBS 931.73 TaxID=1314790 RepID=A0A1Y1XW20_9FUNG|nr:hypothetical protein K493DRAFT_305699 [Basidiobolus meristosporus CBS 931.73]|eukprot:ORX89514.1 hypothetical protein K493DRAFT_305699 [Basidiobolus meristosporus CBS 931.73]
MPTHGELIGNLVTAGNVMSLMGCAFVILNYHLIYRRFLVNAPNNIIAHHRSLFFLSIINVFLNGGGLMYQNLDWKGTRTICVLQALHITYFNAANWFWGICICVNIYTILLPPEKFLFMRKKIMTKFTIFALGLPSILMLPLITNLDEIGPVGGWCWIKPAAGGLRIGTFYGWLLLSFVMYIILLVATLYQVSVLRKNPWEQKRKSRHPYEKLLNRYVLYVLIFFICWTPGAVNRIIQLSNPGFYSFVLDAMHTYLSISESFWLSLVFGFTTSLSEIYKIIWKGGLGNVKPANQSSNWSASFTGMTKLEEIEHRDDSDGWSRPGDSMISIKSPS